VVTITFVKRAMEASPVSASFLKQELHRGNVQVEIINDSKVTVQCLRTQRAAIKRKAESLGWEERT